jgi:hypothetical protein
MVRLKVRFTIIARFLAIEDYRKLTFCLNYISTCICDDIFIFALAPSGEEMAGSMVRTTIRADERRRPVPTGDDCSSVELRPTVVDTASRASAAC